MILARLTQSAFEPTFGVLMNDENQQIAVTLELPWKDNLPNESCIPAGVYQCVRYHSPERGYDVFLLENVPGREAIEIHIGNTVHDTDGCLLIGTRYGTVNNVPAVVSSGSAFMRWMAMQAGIDRFTLTITAPVATL